MILLIHAVSIAFWLLYILSAFLTVLSVEYDHFGLVWTKRWPVT